MQVPEADRERRLAIFRPAFSQLVNVVRGHCRFPDNWRGLDRSERSDFKRARYAIGDTLTDAAGEARLLSHRGDRGSNCHGCLAFLASEMHGGAASRAS